jgi:hypothetical protein
MAWHIQRAGQGKARQGKARQGKAGQGKPRQGKANQTKARQDKTKQSKAKQNRQTGRQTDRQTGRHADRHTDRQTGRQTDRQTDTHTDRQAGTHLEDGGRPGGLGPAPAPLQHALHEVQRLLREALLRLKAVHDLRGAKLPRLRGLEASEINEVDCLLCSLEHEYDEREDEERLPSQVKHRDSLELDGRDLAQPEGLVEVGR